MKPFTFRPGLSGALALPLLVAGVALAEKPPSCASVALKVQADVTAHPERVLIIVEDALVVDDTCACEVTKAAIVASKAKPRLVGQIVFTAVSASPKSAALIAECAAATSPNASGDIKSALTKALGGVPVAATASVAASAEVPSGVASVAPPDGVDPGAGKNPAPDKNPPPPPAPPEPAPDFTMSPVAIGGVYLVFPAGGGSPVLVDQQSIRTIIRQPPRKPRVIIVHPPTATSSIELPGQ